MLFILQGIFAEKVAEQMDVCVFVFFLFPSLSVETSSLVGLFEMFVFCVNTKSSNGRINFNCFRLKALLFNAGSMSCLWHTHTWPFIHFLVFRHGMVAHARHQA